MSRPRREVRRHRKTACERCGIPATRDNPLNLHHRDGDKTNNDPANFETICKACHERHHRLHPPGQPTPDGGEPFPYIAPALRPLAVPIQDLHPDPRNARQHGPRNLRAIKASLREFGQQKPVVALPDGTVKAGNGTLAAARDMGWSHLAVVRWAGNPELADAFAIADNRSQELGEWNPAVLAEELSRLEERGMDLDAMLAFKRDEVSDLLERSLGGGRASRSDQDDEEAAAPARTVTQPGDVWIFPTGHRVICGDSTNPDTLRQLMQGAQADVIFTDPPYGVGYGDAKEGHEWRPIHGDRLESDALAGFLAAAFKAMRQHARPDAAWYVWHASMTRDAFSWALRAAGVIERQYLLWVKPSHVLGRNDYHYQHEPCFYATVDGAAPKWFGDRAQTTAWHVRSRQSAQQATTLGNGLVVSDGRHQVWLSPRPPKGKKVRVLRLEAGQVLQVQTDDDQADVWTVERDSSPEHPTQKPVELAARALRNSTLPGELVLDPFLGSGSTLIAAEQMGRRCYGVELDAGYVDVVIRRYRKATGKVPSRPDGSPWRDS